MASLYIHIPFCERKCFYCSFVVVVGQDRRVDEYLNCVIKEARAYKGALIETVYIGGGTPSLLTSDQWKAFLDEVNKIFLFSPSAEFTVEGNPESIDLEKLRVLRDQGVNRLSIGVQSFHDPYLQFLGRCHSADEARRAFERARAAGFDNINLDLMFSFPGQTQKQIEDDVTQLSALGPEHVSLYMLNLEANSRFFARRISLPGQDEQARQYCLVHSLLESVGFQQYEISNYSRPGKKSAHNIQYWTGGDYIGLGVAAHAHRGGTRVWNVGNFREYLTRVQSDMNPAEGSETLSLSERLMETVLLGLRMNQGSAIVEEEKRFDQRLAQDKINQIADFVQEGFLFWEAGRLKPTMKGMLVLDEISARLI